MSDHVTWIERLAIRCDQACDLSPLASLQDLRVLTLEGARTDLGPLGALHLTTLELGTAYEGMDKPPLEGVEVKQRATAPCDVDPSACAHAACPAKQP